MDRKRTANAVSSLRYFIRRFGRRSVMLRALLVSLILGIALPSLLTISLYNVFSRYTARQTVNVAQHSLSQTAATMNIILNALYRQTEREYRTNSTLIMGMESDHMTPYDYYSVSSSLGEIVNSNTLIDSAVVYNDSLDMFYSSIGVMQPSTEFYDADITALLRKHWEEGSNNWAAHSVYYRPLHYSYAMVPHSLNAITFVFSETGKRFALIFNIDQLRLQEIIESGEADASTRSMIISDSGIVVSDSITDNIYTDISDTEYFRSMAADDAGSFMSVVDGRQCLIIYNQLNTSIGMQLTVAQLYDVNALNASIREVLGISLLIAIFGVTLLAFGLIASLGRLLIPMNRILSMTNTDEYDSQPSEFLHIEQSIQTLSQSVSQFEKVDYLINAMRGGSVANHVGQSERFGLQDDALCVVGLVRIPDSGTQYDEVIASVCAALSACERCIPLGYVESSLFGWVSFTETIDNDTAGVNAVIAAMSGTRLQVGTGALVQLCRIKDGYQSAFTALEYSYLDDAAAVIRYADINHRETIRYSYPTLLEKDLLQRLKSGDDALEALNAVVNAIQAMSVHQAKFALRQLLLKLLALFPEGESEAVQAGVLSHTNMLMSLPTIHEASDWLRLLTDRLAAASRRRKDDKLASLADEVRQIVQDSYMDNALSVETIAQQVGLSPNYLRTLFKDVTDITLSKYIQDVRIEAAAHLLETTNLPAARIAEQVGFAEGSYFYTLFKRVKHLSPDEWRRANRT
jgi:AraC-like DNA-binding protein